MRRLFGSFVLVFALIAIGCESDHPAGPTDDALVERTAESLGLSLPANHRGADLLAGRATTAGGGLERIVEVLAVNTRRGAFGRYRVTLPTLDLFFSVEVTCLTVEEDTAWVGGVISETNASFVEVGTVSYFYAVDNRFLFGGGDPDVVSTARFNDVDGEDLLFCADTPLLLPPAEVIEGGVLVR